MHTTRVTMALYGLSCRGSGALAVERALAKLPGVVRAYVSPALEMAYVEYDPTRLDRKQLVAAVESAGFRSGEPTVR